MSAALRIACAAVFLCLSVLTTAASDSQPAPCGPGLKLTGDQVAQRLAAKNAERAQHLSEFRE